jgi:hypothetical protein
VRLAANVHLAGYPGHPIDAAARARGEPETDDQVGDIVLEDDVWLATGVTVLKGVRIGCGTIVGAGSVVTRDLPAFVLAGGAPARVIRSIEQGASQKMAVPQDRPLAPAAEGADIDTAETTMRGPGVAVGGAYLASLPGGAGKRDQ